MPDTKTLVTGASGFVGQGLLQRLQAEKVDYRTLSLVGKPLVGFDFTPYVAPVEYVVHLAGLAHASNGRFDASNYMQVNCDYPVALARAAIDANVKRFIFVSSIKAKCYDASLTSNVEQSGDIPSDHYGLSKYSAEQQLLALDWKQCHLTIVRPSLIYGAGVKGNLASLMRHAPSWYFPLIMGGGARSFVARDDVIDVILELCKREAMPSPVYIVTGNQDVSIDAWILAIRQLDQKERPLCSLSADGLFMLGRLLSPVLMLMSGGRLNLILMLEKMLARESYSGALIQRDLAWLPQSTIAKVLPEMKKYHDN